MEVLLSTLNQMSFLLLLIAIGFILSKCSIVSEATAGILSKLENTVFIPALVFGTFVDNFTIERIKYSWIFFAAGSVIALVGCVVAVFVSRLCTRDEYLQKIYTYGLAFSNFGFMGNAVVLALFPDVFMDYLIFNLPMWVAIYVWGVPYLLIPRENATGGKLSGLKNIINPMFIAMFIAMIIGLVNIKLPAFIGSAATSLGNCMSPIAMLLTGMTVSKIDLKATLKNISIYAVTIIRLLIFPIVTIGILFFLPLPYMLELCIVCFMAMPLGLNTIIVPLAYGKNASVATGMALISHVLSVVTVPLIFMLFALIK